MSHKPDLTDLAAKYHKMLPKRIRRYLNDRGLPDVIIDFHLLGWNGWRITIPVFNREGELVFFKLARDPEDRLSPKMTTYPGGPIELYGWEQVLRKPPEIVICEGEFDRLVLEANRLFAVTSTGGAGAFRCEWAKDFSPIPKVYICFDNDDAGRSGALRIARMIPHARIIELPQEVEHGGDVTDFFVRLGGTRDDFLKLMSEAKSPAPRAEAPPPANLPRSTGANPLLRDLVRRLKRDVPITKVIGEYIRLQPSGEDFVGLCPFHDDHKPSLMVYPASGMFHCYGCCKHGDVITFLQEIDNLSFSQALAVLERFDNQYGTQPE